MKSLIALVIVGIIGTISSIILGDFSKLQKEQEFPHRVCIDQAQTPETIEGYLTSLLVKNGCVLPNVAIAQFKIETAHFTSDIYIDNNNVAGIRTSRSAYVKGYNRGHCVYETVEDCILDYIRIQNQYLAQIDGVYAEDESYVELIKKVK